MRWDELPSLLGPPFVLGALAGALLASGALRSDEERAAEEAAAAEVEAAAAAALRVEARVEELRSELSRYETNPLRDQIEGALDSNGSRERSELIARIAAPDTVAIQAVEAAAERARSRYARGLYLALLFRGTKQKRWLDDLLATADMRVPVSEARGTEYWNMLGFALEPETLDEEARTRVLDFLATRSPQEAASALALQVCMGCYAPEQFKTPATYYALIQRLRDHALEDATPGAMLASLSPEAYVVTLAKLLASESARLARRASALESHRVRSERLARWNSALAATLPKELEPQEWQRWIAAHDALVTKWLEPDLVKSHGL